MRRTNKTVITIETFPRTVVRTRRTSTAVPNDEHTEEAAVNSETIDPLQRSVQELARTAKACEEME